MEEIGVSLPTTSGDPQNYVSSLSIITATGFHGKQNLGLVGEDGVGYGNMDNCFFYYNFGPVN